MLRTFQLSDAKSHKFWNIEVDGKTFTVNYGKIGTSGASQTKAFQTPEKAQAEADKLIAEKVKKGYHETTPKQGGSEADAFEAAILANPHEPASVAAYADWLIEKGDPTPRSADRTGSSIGEEWGAARGEFMQVQLALENESLAPAERKKLQKREQALLKAHEKEWVGDWADRPDVGQATNEWSPPKGWMPYQFRRGILTTVEVGDLTVELARTLAKAPQLRLVTKLTVHGIAFEEEGEYEEGPDTRNVRNEDPAQHVLVRWGQLRHLRTFRFGGSDPEEYDGDWCPYSCHTQGDLIADFAKQMPHIEELHIMTHFRGEAARLAQMSLPQLRVLLLYHGWEFPLQQLARNASLTNLRELYCHPHALEGGDEPYIGLSGLRAVCRSKYLTNLTHLQLRLADLGDEGIQEIISSGILKRLKMLDLRHGTVTDAGAQALAACPDVKNLEHLDLSWNRLTDVGVNALKATGVKATLNRQQSPTGDDWETFGHGDIE